MASASLLYKRGEGEGKVKPENPLRQNTKRKNMTLDSKNEFG